MANVNDITIIGAGTAGFELAKKLRTRNKEIKVTLIDKAAHYFDKKQFIKALDFRGYIDLQDFCKNENIVFIQDTVERVNAERCKIYFKNNEPLEYKFLVIATGLKSKDISIKGDHREGLFYLSGINYLETKNLLKIYSEIIVYVSTMLGLELALSLKKLGKQVRVISQSLDFLSAHKEEAINLFNEKEIPLHLNTAIEEVIGEGQIKATKVTPLKVFSSQLVFIDSKFIANIDFFDSLLGIKNVMETAYENLYVIGDANGENFENEYFYVFNQEEAIRQANLIGDFILESKPINFERKVLTEEQRSATITNFLSDLRNIIIESPAKNQG